MMNSKTTTMILIPSNTVISEVNGSDKMLL
jgi:hypothetical protein